METIEKTIEIDAPVKKVYNQWTQFEDFPRFMEGVEQVTQIDDIMKKNGKVCKLRDQRGGFERFARKAARASGRPSAFGMALALIVIWAATGPLFHFSDTWQLVINTGTTIITFLMVFLIQNTQNRDSEALQLKLDELIRASGDCHNAVLDIEELSEAELDTIKRGYTILAKRALQDVRAGKSDLGVPDVDKKRSADKAKG